MKVPKQDREVRQIEMVETYNLYRSLERLKTSAYQAHWKRALYHALGMSNLSGAMLEEIRKALELP